MQNIVEFYKHWESINLNRIATRYGLEYFPEVFPTVRYRDERQKVTVNIFHTGNSVFLGDKPMTIVNETEASTTLGIKANLKFIYPFGCMASGPSRSGKSHFILNVTKHSQNLFDPPPDLIVYAHNS